VLVCRKSISRCLKLTTDFNLVPRLGISEGMSIIIAFMSWTGKTYLFKLSVYHPGVFTKFNKLVFTSQTHLVYCVLREETLIHYRFPRKNWLRPKIGNHFHLHSELRHHKLNYMGCSPCLIQQAICTYVICTDLL